LRAARKRLRIAGRVVGLIKRKFAEGNKEGAEKIAINNGKRPKIWHGEKE
jgi:hypothetical protein